MKIGEVDVTFVHGDILNHLDWLESINASLVLRRKTFDQMLREKPLPHQEFSESPTEMGHQSDSKS